MKTVLENAFYNRPTLTVAEELLGMFLVTRRDGKTAARMITEIEAYDGFDDTASHAHKGRTPRTEVMFGAAGHWYVYLVYGMHQMLNVVTGDEGYPAAILIRGVKGIDGPGRLTKRLGIDRTYNHKSVSLETGLWIEDRGVVVPRHSIKRTPRVGVAYAGPIWANKPYRFVIVKEGT